ncbi:hypothetical protein ZYGR_0P03850 [Zygosaccharomyces rouxii]|uniref:ZYRO0E09350p n=2 Tax=Zygosaccharomyces rouxii TaxID=4956 RepID=C5E4W8_ZYGRC|nr:uncharacterized protein ZYRO0E09350g [Zygosaccharomyces rouxii]KAH9198066.1 hypothetical protein LQ764DRAFT_146139 [Zygosaccharomyces rouxii]GAV49739.1 hypothetical protein ZYGR_0P03850 [Zygosaccharomyces rouxii]CAR31079.1 ZYRO0E09350p [Zygosaccharomyces rouxii]
MDTPKRFNDPGSDFLATTPFRERALQEQRLKEELLSSATPGWRRKSPERHVDAISKDPSEVKEYLRDLSSVLVSQGRNLTSFLAEQVSTQDDQADTEIKSSPKEPTPQKPHYSIAESVLSQLESGIRKPKIRKIDGLVIKDKARTPFQEDHLPERQMSLQESVRSPSVVEESIPIPEDDYEDEPLVENGLDPSPLASAPIESPQGFESDQSSVDSEPETVDPLNITRLKHSLGQFMNENDIKLGQGSWRSLQDASVTLVERLAKHFTEEDRKIVLDRQSILKMLEQFEIVPLRATNDDIFEMCCKYLPLEDLNELEMGLFL